jgi:ribonuclease D
MTIRLHQDDIPDLSPYTGEVAVDTEALGLNPHRDRLCLVQLSPGDGTADIIQIAAEPKPAPNLLKLLADPAHRKIFHFARFDLALLFHTFAVMAQPVFCTKIASRLVRTYTDRHSLKDLTREFLDFELSKQQQSSDWAASVLSEAQLAYAAADVLYLHRIRMELETRLARDGRRELAESCFAFLPTRIRLDLAGWADEDIFAHI